MEQKIDNVKNYILNSTLPSRDAQEIVKILNEILEEFNGDNFYITI
jgi:endonuclease III